MVALGGGAVSYERGTPAGLTPDTDRRMAFDGGGRVLDPALTCWTLDRVQQRACWTHSRRVGHTRHVPYSSQKTDVMSCEPQHVQWCSPASTKHAPFRVSGCTKRRSSASAERDLFIDNLLDRIHIEMILVDRPRAMGV
jgi:hypothetical protein